MWETISNNLDNYDNGLESQKEIELAELINDTKLNENEHANDVIKWLDSSKLSSYIEKSFKENDNRLTYWEMKRTKISSSLETLMNFTNNVFIQNNNKSSVLSVKSRLTSLLAK